MMKKILAGTAIAAIASVVSLTSVSAMPMPVVEWAATIDSMFTSAAPSPDVVISGGGAILTWGTPITDPVQAGPSRLVQGGPGFDPAAFNQSTGTGGESTNLVIAGGLMTNDGIGVDGLSLTHFNNRISGAPGAPDALTDAVLQDRIQLTAVDPVGGAFDTMDFDFNITFTETNNFDDPCPAGDPQLCDDIFVLSNTGPLSFNFSIGDGFIYTLFLLIFDDEGNPLGNLTDAQCAAAGADNGCFGFITEEGANTQIFTRIFVTAVPVPAPAALGLLGLGLIGLGAARRRRS